MAIRRILIATIATTIVLTLFATYVYACGGENPFAAKKECYMVVIQTGVGSRCSRIFHYGLWKSYDEANAWAKQTYPHEPASTEVTVYPLEFVSPSEK